MNQIQTIYATNQTEPTTHHPGLTRRLLLIAWLLLSWVWWATPAAGAAPTVTCIVGGPSQTHATFALALADGNCSTINLNDSLTLSGSHTITRNLTITGSTFLGAVQVTFDGGNANRLFTIGADNLTVILNTLRLQNGGNLATTPSGGAIYNPFENSSITVQNVDFVGNQAESGGAIWSVGAVTVTDSSFTNQTALTQGGAIYQQAAALDINRSTFTNNSTATGAAGRGGALFQWLGSLNLRNSSFSGNSAVAKGGTIYLAWTPNNNYINNTVFDDNTAVRGGAIYLEPSTALAISASDFNNNESSSPEGAYGGAMYSQGYLDITDSNFLNNTTSDWGGAIFNDAGALLVENSTFNNNHATNSVYGYGGAIGSDAGSITIRHSTLQNNSSAWFAGGVHIYGVESPNSALIENSTFIGNTAQAGGAVLVLQSQATIRASTFTENVGSVQGAAFHLQDSEVAIINSTVSENIGYNTIFITLNPVSEPADTISLIHTAVVNNEDVGIYQGFNAVSPRITLVLQNSIVAGHTVKDCDRSDTTIVVDSSAGYNLDSDGSCIDSNITGNQTAANLGLAPLADNGGPTQTHLLLPNSPVRNQIPAGSSGCGTSYTTDQRGKTRPTDSACDIGPVEISCTDLGYTFPYAVGTVLAADHATDLVNAISCANTNNTDDTITLTADVVLTKSNNTQSGNNGLPLINSDITLNGAGYSLARDSSYGCNSGDPDFRLLMIPNGGQLTLNSISLQNGCAPSNSTIGRGGAIWNAGSLQISDSNISSNKASSFGAGIYNSGANGLTITGSTLRDNQRVGGTLAGGGLYNAGSLVSVTDTTIENNEADKGAGIANAGGMILNRSTISHNTAPSFGQTAGIYNSGTMSVVNSTVSGNTQFAEGAVFNASNATLWLIYSTIAANQTGLNSGGVVNDGSLILTGALIADNTMLLTPTANVDCDNRAGSITDNGYNLVETATNCISNGNTNQVGVDPLLGMLADNGGSTWTHALQSGSAAIESGNNSDCEGALVNNSDQRGVARPQGSNCDVGAYEFAGETAVSPTLTMLPNGFYSWTPSQATCTEGLYRSSTPYVGHTWLTDDPANYDGSGSLRSIEINYFYYLTIDCEGSTAESNEVGEFTFAIAPGN